MVPRKSPDVQLWTGDRDEKNRCDGPLIGGSEPIGIAPAMEIGSKHPVSEGNGSAGGLSSQ